MFVDMTELFLKYFTLIDEVKKKSKFINFISDVVIMLNGIKNLINDEFIKTRNEHKNKINKIKNEMDILKKVN